MANSKLQILKLYVLDTIIIHNNPTKEHNTKNNMMFPNISTIVTTQAYTMMNIQSFKPCSILFLFNVFLRVVIIIINYIFTYVISSTRIINGKEKSKIQATFEVACAHVFLGDLISLTVLRCVNLMVFL